MKKPLLFTMMILGVSFVQAQEKNAKKNIYVDGVCNSCKNRIEKNSLKVKGVKYANWNVETHLLSLIIDERKTDLTKVQEAIAKAGHDNTTIDGKSQMIASEKDYESISACCKYRDEEVIKNHP